MKNTEKKLLDSLKRPAKYAKEVNVSAKSVYQWMKQGRVESINIDGVLFVIDRDNIC